MLKYFQPIIKLSHINNSIDYKYAHIQCACITLTCAVHKLPVFEQVTDDSEHLSKKNDQQ